MAKKEKKAELSASAQQKADRAADADARDKIHKKRRKDFEKQK